MTENISTHRRDPHGSISGNNVNPSDQNFQPVEPMPFFDKVRGKQLISLCRVWSSGYSGGRGWGEVGESFQMTRRKHEPQTLQIIFLNIHPLNQGFGKSGEGTAGDGLRLWSVVSPSVK